MRHHLPQSGLKSHGPHGSALFRVTNRLTGTVTRASPNRALVRLGSARGGKALPGASALTRPAGQGHGPLRQQTATLRARGPRRPAPVRRRSTCSRPWARCCPPSRVSLRFSPPPPPEPAASDEIDERAETGQVHELHPVRRPVDPWEDLMRQAAESGRYEAEGGLIVSTRTELPNKPFRRSPPFRLDKSVPRTMKVEGRHTREWPRNREPGVSK